MRRLRLNTSVRALLQETYVRVEDLIAPLFVVDSPSGAQDVDSMPGIQRLGLRDLVRECEVLHTLGIRAVAVFPCIEASLKDPRGSYGLRSDGLIPRAVRAIKKALPELVVITDVALDPYTSHGHDGLVDARTGEVLNDATVEALVKLALVEAEAGADWVAPSDMMDGRIRAIRQGLDEENHVNTSILAYSAKFASAYYGPFRDAIGSQQAAGRVYLDKRSYQLNPANPREALQDALLDETEGADLLMVKPAGPYLDILHALRQSTLLPLVAYQVSGEYSQIQAAARLGWLDLERTRDESLLGIRRAGADLIITYFAKEVAKQA
jgi:porphobilinogen synthase